MSMLAERKRKTKYVINPTKKPLWTTDSNGIKFSKGLLEKMGWTPGKGLGVNEQGIQEPLKVSYKNDTKGMGFKGNDDDWIEYQDEFNCLLNELRNSDESFVVKASDAEKIKAESLEQKSKCSKARVHYQKFTRGKDLSRYSENDLACILGTNKTKSKQSNTKEMTEVNYKANDSFEKANDSFETRFGVTTINSGSIQDYFKKKWIFRNKSRDTPDAGDKVAHNFQIKEAKNFKRKLNLNFKESANMKRTMTPESDEMEKRDKKKKKKREKNLNSEEEPEIKRRKKNHDFDLINDASVEVAFSLEKKKKESKDVLEIENNECVIEKSNIKNKNKLEINDTNKEKELKYKKKKKEKGKALKENKELENKYISSIQNTYGSDKKEFYQEANTNGINGEEENYVFQSELMIKKKKKKSKKQKHFDEIKDNIFFDISNASLNNQNIAYINKSCSEVELKKKKKKKKEKKKSAEKEEVECFDNCYRLNLINCNADGKTAKSKSGREISTDLMLISKQKKKKNKKEKLVEKEEIEFVANINLSLEKENIQNTSEVKVVSESVRKKEKKKDKKEKSVEKEKVKNLKTSKNDIIDFCIEENKRTKKRQFFSEIESLKKKKKNSEKKNLLEIQFESENSISQTTKALKINDENGKNSNEINKRKLVSENNSFKKKKKSEKEKLVEKEKTEFVEDCSGLNIEPSGEEENIKSASKVKGVSEVALIKKKHKKGKIKEVLNGLNETENSKSNMKEKKINSVNEKKNTQEVEVVNEREQDNNNFIENSCENKESQENKVESKEEKIKKTDIINKKVGFTNFNKINYNCHINHKNDINFPQTNFGGIMDSLNLLQNSSNCINKLNFLQNGYGCNVNSLSFPHNSLGYNINNYYSQINNNNNNNFLNHQNILNLFNFLYSYNYFNNVMSLNNSKIDGEHEVRNHKMEFLNEKNVDKFYHGHNKRERILRLMHLSDFAKFKGSNVEKLMGYGIL